MVQSPSPHVIRIFLASPNDVSEERAQARHLIKDDLPTLPLLKDEVWLKLVAWEDPTSRAPMPATLSPQKAIELGIPRPAACDIVVVVFWSRMGTPLDEERHGLKDGKRPYWSGTEWEYEDALQASETTGKPVVLVYRRTARVPFNVEDADFDERVEQYKRVKEFFAEFRDPTTGAWLRSYTEYDTPDQFGELLKNDLLFYIKQWLEEPRVSPPIIEVEPPKPLWPTGKSPFPGLRAFTPDDQPVFFGRERETDTLLKRINEQRFVAVVGASGSGKSSLVGAGLIPRLTDNALPGSKDWLLPHMQGADERREWGGLRFTPGEVSDNPFSALAVKLAPYVRLSTREITDQLTADPGALCALGEQALSHQPEWAELLLFIDQFEELFTVVKPDYRAPFVDLLAVGANTNRLRTVLTLRADFYHRCVEYPRLAELLREGSFPLAAPELDALLEMIERPAVVAGLMFEPGLPGRLLRDTGQEPGALALLAYALDELYHRARASRLTLVDYEALEGVQGAIGTRAEAVFSKLGAASQDTLPHVFRELVEVDERGTATRQRAPLSRFEGNAAAWTLLEKFTQARLLTTSTSDDGAVIEVAHEALFRSWLRLKTWIDATQVDLFLLRQIRLAAQEWLSNAFSDDFLWSGQRLKEAQQMVARLHPRLSEVEEEFLRSEVGRLVEKLKNPYLDHAARAQIGEQLHIIGDTRPGVGLRPDGLPDIVWCPVPAGKISIENHIFTVEPFYIAQYPITYAQFQVFVDAEDGFHDPQWWEELAADEDHKRALGKQRFKLANHSRENVSWWDAVAFCRWLNAKLPPDGWPEGVNLQSHPHKGLFSRGQGEPQWTICLPTEWEWQQAATGGQSENTYPWGQNWDEGHRCNTSESGLSRTTAVGIYLHGTSPVGALDMAGNVWEWCLNEHNQPENTALSGDVARVVRGGSWFDFQSFARCASRNPRGSRYRLDDFGFRVCVAARPIL